MSAQCPIHNQPMYEKDGQYGTFWSHKTDDPAYEGQKGYCNGKKPKEPSYQSSGYQNFKAVGESLAHRAPEVREPIKEEKTDWAEKDRRISRMSCHKQAIEFMRVLLDYNIIDKPVDEREAWETLTSLTVQFEQDLDRK